MEMLTLKDTNQPGNRVYQTDSSTTRYEAKPEDLFQYFSSAFDMSKFNTVFYWVSKVIDYLRSTARGQQYLTQAWVNLAVQVKLHWDIEQAGNHKLIIGNWTEIVRWWNVMVQDRHYKDVVRSDLAEVRSPVITGTKRKAGEELWPDDH